MTVSNSPMSYSDCYAVLDAALSDPEGVRMRFGDSGSAHYFRIRCHKAKVIDREKNAKTYPPDHPLYHSSDYDRIVIRFRVDDEGPYLDFAKITFIPGRLESLSGSPVNIEMKQLMAVRREALPPPEAVSIEEGFDALEPVEEEMDQPQNGLRRI